MKIKKIKFVLLVLLLVNIVLGAAYLGITTWYGNTAKGRFERLLLDPVPASVKFIDSHGCVSMAGGSEVIVFSIAPHDLDVVLLAGGFKPYGINTASVYSLEHQIALQARACGVEPVHAYKAGDASFLLLLTDAARTKAFLYRFRL